MCCRGEPHWIGQSKFSANYNTSQKLWNLIIRRRSFTFLHLIDLKILVPLYFCRIISINMIPASFSENLLVRFGTQILPHPFNSWVMGFEPFPKSAGKGRLDAKWMDGWNLGVPNTLHWLVRWMECWRNEGQRKEACRASNYELGPGGPPDFLSLYIPKADG